MFVWFYLLSAILCLIAILAGSYKVSREFKREHPGFRFPESNIVAKVEAILKMAFLVLMPFVNTIMAFVFIYSSDEIVKKTVSKLEDKYKT